MDPLSKLNLCQFSITILGKIINCNIPPGIHLGGSFKMQEISDKPDATLLIEVKPNCGQFMMTNENGVVQVKISCPVLISVNIFRSLIGLILHYLTDSIFMHGSGLMSIVHNKGIIFLGQKASGKSTLTREISFTYIIDDDQVLLSGDQIVNIGKKSAHTVNEKKGQMVIYEKADHLSAKLGLIFALDKTLTGGEIEEISSQQLLLKPELFWHHNFSAIDMPKDYLATKTLPQIPIYRVGTSGNLAKTVSKIEMVIKYS